MPRFCLVFAALILVNIAAAQPGRDSSIAGRVLNATTGAPLNRVTVQIEVEGQPDIRGMAPTNAEGDFLLRALPPGRYVITASKPGYGMMKYGARHPGGPGQVVTVGPHENKSGLLIRLPRFSTISGTIYDAGGNTARGTYVMAYRQEFPRGKPGWTQVGGGATNDNGQYRIPHLRPGRYVVSANGGPGRMVFMGSPADRERAERQPQPTLTFHPSSLTAVDATPIDLPPGATVRDIDITVQEIAPVRLSVHLQAPPELAAPSNAPADGSPPVPRLFAPIWYRPVGTSSPAALQTIGGGLEARQENRPLSPGRYVFFTQAEYGGKCYAARREETLSGGAINVNLPLAPCIDLAGHVRILGGGSAANLKVTLITGEQSPAGTHSATVQPDGSFLIKGVPPGIWDIDVTPIPASGYLKSMRLGKEDVLTKDMVISSATSQPLEIEVSTRAAGLSGHVENGYATTVLAAPQGDLASVLSFYAATGVDENGDFRFHGLVPGSYRIYAFEDMQPQAWFDPDFLKNYTGAGTPIDLAEGAAPEIKVNAIPGSAERQR